MKIVVTLVKVMLTTNNVLLTPYEAPQERIIEYQNYNIQLQNYIKSYDNDNDE